MPAVLQTVTDMAMDPPDTAQEAARRVARGVGRVAKAVATSKPNKRRRRKKKKQSGGHYSSAVSRKPKIRRSRKTTDTVFDNIQ